MIDVSFAEVAVVGAGGSASLRPPTAAPSRFHHHEWHADVGDTHWTCPCGAWVGELRTTTGTIVPLPKAAA